MIKNIFSELKSANEKVDDETKNLNIMIQGSKNPILKRLERRDPSHLQQGILFQQGIIKLALI
jgi:hypothetical protein